MIAALGAAVRFPINEEQEPGIFLLVEDNKVIGYLGETTDEKANIMVET